LRATIIKELTYSTAIVAFMTRSQKIYYYKYNSAIGAHIVYILSKIACKTNLFAWCDIQKLYTNKTDAFAGCAFIQAKKIKAHFLKHTTSAVSVPITVIKTIQYFLTRTAKTV